MSPTTGKVGGTLHSGRQTAWLDGRPQRGGLLAHHNGHAALLLSSANAILRTVRLEPALRAKGAARSEPDNVSAPHVDGL